MFRIRNTPYQSERLMDIAVEQQANYQNLARLLDDLIALSQKTFGVDRSISRKFGVTSQEMQKSIAEMEQRRPNQAARSSDRAILRCASFASAPKEATLSKPA